VIQAWLTLSLSSRHRAAGIQPRFPPNLKVAAGKNNLTIDSRPAKNNSYALPELTLFQPTETPNHRL